jgi:hypothetical protein
MLLVIKSVAMKGSDKEKVLQELKLSDVSHSWRCGVQMECSCGCIAV